MKKEEFLAHLRALYRAANSADQPDAPDWMKGEMVSEAGCRQLDRMLHHMILCGALTQNEYDEFVNSI